MSENRCNQKIPVARLETTIDKLDKLHKKPKAEFTLRETIYQLRHKLNSALKKGYSYEDLAQILESQHITISPRTLQQYLSDTRRRSASKPKPCSSVSNKSSIKAAKDNTSDLDSLTTSTKQTKKALPSNRKSLVPRLAKAGLASDRWSNSKTTSSNFTTDTKEKIDNTKSAPDESIKRKFTGLSSSTEDLSNEFNQY